MNSAYSTYERYRYQSTAQVRTQQKMKVLIVLLMKVMLVFSTTGMKDQETRLLAMDTTACPPWFALQNTSGTDRCACINSTDTAVKCDQLAQRSYLLLGYCMTHDDSSGNTFLGRCPYYQKPTDHWYLKLPTNISHLNHFMCSPLNRKGLLCKDCLDGFGPAPSYACENCKQHDYQGVVIYLLLEFVPITAFYLLVLVFQIRVTSAPLNGFILFSQAVVSAYNSLVDFNALLTYTDTLNILAKILFTGYGIWNLEFFHYFVPPFCVSENIRNVHMLMLHYIPAIYPLCLIAITYVCIKLHDRNFRPIVWLWRPFHKCFTRARRSWDSQASIVDVFATFLLLSYSKFLFVSLYLLHGTTIHNSYGVAESKVLYIDVNIKYFSKEHLPYAVAAILILTIFTLSPALLLLCYPTKLFRKCTSYCRLRRWQTLHIFVEKFQGCYKDGIDGSTDFRSLAGLYLVVRIALMTSGDVETHSSTELAWLLRAIISLGTSLFIAIARPYKRNYMNVLESLMLALLGLVSLLILAYQYVSPSEAHLLLLYLILTLISIPQLVLILYILYHPLRGRRLVKYITVKITNLKTNARDQNTEQQIPDSLPDRLVNPDEYRPLLPVEGDPELAHQQDSTESGNHERCITPVYTYGSVN